MKTIDVKEEILNENKFIAPYRLLILMKLTSRIIDILSENAEIIMTYNEINLILKVVKAAVEGAQGEGNDKN